MQKGEELIRSVVNFDNSSQEENIIDFEVVYNSSVQSTTNLTPFCFNYCIHPETSLTETLKISNPTASDLLKNIEFSTIVTTSSQETKL